MKLIIASDIHGGEKGAEFIKNVFLEEKADKLVLCGDLLYHGPRNDLPDDYNPKAVIKILNSMCDNILAVRGNCDAEVDQMVLEFPIMSDYIVINDNDLRMYITHGHIYNEQNPMKLKENDVLVCGHTHVLKLEKSDYFYHVNPGSCTLPKEENPKTYIVYENKKFTVKTFDNCIIKEMKI